MRYLSIFCVLFIFFQSVLANELPPVHEAARLNLALENSVKLEQWQNASEQLSELRSLDVKQPLDSYYYEGLVLLKLGQLKQAKDVLTHYVINSGEKGAFYKPALEAITSSKAMMTQERVVVPSLSQIKHAEGEREAGDGYVKSLQALYMVDSAQEALLLQVNSLLASHPYTGERIKKSATKKGVRYKVQIKGRDLVVQEKDYRSGLPILKARVQPVLGIDPFVSFGCSNIEYKCWLNNPVDKHRHWLLFDYDELIANELASTLSKLIIELQRH